MNQHNRDEINGEEQVLKGELIRIVEGHPLSGNDYFSCIQCGRCVGSCPAAKVSPRFNMRVINRRIMDDDWSLLEDDIIWDCFFCQACVNLCPRENIDGYKTILVLRDLALQREKGLRYMKNIIPVMDVYLIKGVLIDDDTWLPPDALEEVCKINDISGTTKKIQDLKERYSKKEED